MRTATEWLKVRKDARVTLAMRDSARDTGHEQDQGNSQPGPSGVVAHGDSNTNGRANQNAVVTLDSSSEDEDSDVMELPTSGNGQGGQGLFVFIVNKVRLATRRSREQTRGRGTPQATTSGSTQLVEVYPLAQGLSLPTTYLGLQVPILTEW